MLRPAGAFCGEAPLLRAGPLAALSSPAAPALSWFAASFSCVALAGYCPGLLRRVDEKTAQNPVYALPIVSSEDYAPGGRAHNS
jgi:hypothetical protein